MPRGGVGAAAAAYIVAEEIQRPDVSESVHESCEAKSEKKLTWVDDVAKPAALPPPLLPGAVLGDTKPTPSLGANRGQKHNLTRAKSQSSKQARTQSLWGPLGPASGSS